MEYKWTIKDTEVTVINIITVNESNKKPQDACNSSESIHVNKSIYTVFPEIPTSIKAYHEKIQVIPSKVVVRSCEPFVPIYRPKNPAKKAPIRGKNTINKY